jgi:hypothetical protein
VPIRCPATKPPDQNREIRCPSRTHVGTDGVHRDESTKLRLDGKANR